MVKKRIRVTQTKNIENAIMDKILKEIDGEVKKRKQTKTSKRGSTYGVLNEAIKKNTR
jgi:hypothetical protein